MKNGFTLLEMTVVVFVLALITLNLWLLRLLGYIPLPW